MGNKDDRHLAAGCIEIVPVGVVDHDWHGNKKFYIDNLVQDCSHSIADALE